MIPTVELRLGPPDIAPPLVPVYGRDEIASTFMKSGGGGWSFLNACEDRNGVQWTDLHMRMDRLFSLGSAAGMVKQPIPREAWPMLPGGMPYYVVIDEENDNA